MSFPGFPCHVIPVLRTRLAVRYGARVCSVPCRVASVFQPVRRANDTTCTTGELQHCKCSDGDAGTTRAMAPALLAFPRRRHPSGWPANCSGKRPTTRARRRNWWRLLCYPTSPVPTLAPKVAHRVLAVINEGETIRQKLALPYHARASLPVFSRPYTVGARSPKATMLRVDISKQSINHLRRQPAAYSTNVATSDAIDVWIPHGSHILLVKSQGCSPMYRGPCGKHGMPSPTSAPVFMAWHNQQRRTSQQNMVRTVPR